MNNGGSFCSHQFSKQRDVKVFLSLPNTQCAVGLSTRPDPLIISKSFQFRTFWSQSKALFLIRCMISFGSGLKIFGIFRDANVSDLFAKKITQIFSVVLRLLLNRDHSSIKSSKRWVGGVAK